MTLAREEQPGLAYKGSIFSSLAGQRRPWVRSPAMHRVPRVESTSCRGPVHRRRSNAAAGTAAAAGELTGGAAIAAYLLVSGAAEATDQYTGDAAIDTGDATAGTEMIDGLTARRGRRAPALAATAKDLNTVLSDL